MTHRSLLIQNTAISNRARLALPALAGAAWLMRGTSKSVMAQDAAALLSQAAQTMAALQTFHFELTSVNGKTEFVEGVELDDVAGDVKRPLSFRAEASISLTIASIKITIISIDGHAWMTDPFGEEGTFTDLGIADFGALDPTLLINPDRLILPAVAAVQNPAINGTEEINGATATRIDGTVDIASIIALSATPEAVSSAETTITLPNSMPFSAWIDGSNHVVRIELTGPVLENEDNDIIRRVDFSAFDQPVDIQPPTQ